MLHQKRKHSDLISILLCSYVDYETFHFSLYLNQNIVLNGFLD